MKKEQKNIRNRWLTVQLNEEEHSKIKHFYKSTTCNALSKYARNLLQKPITEYFHDKPADEFLSEIIDR